MKNTFKRTICILVNAAAVLLFIGSLSFLYMKTTSEKGITWIEQSEFSESDRFSGMVDNDIINIRRLQILKSAFETNDNDDETNIVAIANSKNGAISYSLADLKKIALDNGCSVDSETGSISITQAGDNSTDYEIKILSKAFDPFYFKNITPGPSQGIMSVKDLSFETMQAYAEYIRLKNTYDDSNSNFVYIAYFINNENETDLISNTNKTFMDIKSMKKCLLIRRDGVIESNIDPAPAKFKNQTNVYQLSDEDEYSLAIGIDTEYPYADRYKKAADSYKTEIEEIHSTLAIFIAAIVIGIISLIFIIRGYGLKDGKKERFSDRIPLELLILLYILGVIVIYVVYKSTLSKAIMITVPIAQYDFWRRLAKAVCVYIAFVFIAGTLYRRAVNGELLQYSILGRIAADAGDPSEVGKTAKNTLAEFVGFTLFNLAGCAAATFLYLNKEKPFFFIFSVIVLMTLICVDVFVCILIYRQRKQRVLLREALAKIGDGNTEIIVDENLYSGGELFMAKNINNISRGLNKALTEQVKAERLKADLITNVSHDIRTPLTSIINYVDLIKREEPQDEKIREYVEVLEKKSARLKNLTEDLLEASKASSGNIKLEMEKLDIALLASQAGGEFDDKMKARGLELDLTTPEAPAYVMADGRHLWRVFENLYNNAAKYALENTRVYADVKIENGYCIFTVKNVSKEKLNISPDELTERFVRGDVSRSTEGSGLGLSIAKSLTTLMGGELQIEIDGDLYKAKVILKEIPAETDVKKEEIVNEESTGKCE